MSWRVGLVCGCVRQWTRIYTFRLPAALRDARREQIESDLWESAHDRTTTEQALVLQLATRLVLGVPHDLAWRLEQLRVGKAALLRAAFAGCAAVALLISVTLSRLNDTPLPAPPVGPRRVASVPPPPPPGPPPGASASQPRFEFARTDYSVMAAGAAPMRVKEVRPIYPPVAFASGLEGEVVVKATITAQGAVIDAEVDPGGILAQSAIDAVQRWEFAPSPDPRTTARLTVRVSFARGNRKPS
jgi:TonB family protein